MGYLFHAPAKNKYIRQEYEQVQDGSLGALQGSSSLPSQPAVLKNDCRMSCLKPAQALSQSLEPSCIAGRNVTMAWPLWKIV